MEDDALLVEGVIRNQPGSDTLFVERYRNLILGLARGRFAFREDRADEILQATMLRLLENDHRVLRAWRRQGRFSTYLTVIVLRLCRQEQIGERITASGVPFESGQHAAPVSPADEEIAAEEKRAAVQQAMKELSVRQQLVLKLRFVDERSAEDIASILRLNPGAARKAVHDAKERLIARLRGSKPEYFSR